MATLQAGSSITAGYSHSSRGWLNRTHKMTGGKVTCQVQILHITGHSLLCGRPLPRTRWRRGNCSSCGRYLMTRWTVCREWRALSCRRACQRCLLPVASTCSPRCPLLPTVSLASAVTETLMFTESHLTDPLQEWWLRPDSLWRNRARIRSNSKARVEPVTRFVCSLSISLGGAPGSHFNLIPN